MRPENIKRGSTLYYWRKRRFESDTIQSIVVTSFGEEDVLNPENGTYSKYVCIVGKDIVGFAKKIYTQFTQVFPTERAALADLLSYLWQKESEIRERIRNTEIRLGDDS